MAKQDAIDRLSFIYDKLELQIEHEYANGQLNHDEYLLELRELNNQYQEDLREIEESN